VSELPKGWAHCVLGDLAEYVTSGSRDWSRYYATKGVLFVRTQDINKNRLASLDDIARVALPDSVEGQRTLIMRDDLLITITGANVGKCAHVDRAIPEAYVSQSVALVRLVDRTLTRFVHRQLIAPGPDGERTLLQQSAYGLGRPVLNLDNIRNTQVYLAPLNEQKRIVDKLDTVLARVDACRERLDRVPAILKRFRQAILTAATSGKLTEEWRMTHDDRLTSKGSVTVSHEGLPSGWRWSCPEEIKTSERYSLAIGPFGSNLKVKDYRPTGVPLVFIKEIRTRNFGGIGTKFVSEEKAADLAAHAIVGGDLLITKMGDPPGDTAIYPKGAPNAVITADCIKLRVNELVAHPVFVGLVIESPSFRERLQEITAGVAQQKISLERFRRFPLQLAPLTEQHEIVRRVEALYTYVDRIEARYTAAHAQVERLTPALLAKAFRGELVPQDPNDEPASVLLERLRAARAAAGEKPPRKVTTERKPMMTQLTMDALKKIILGLPTDQFAFDDLRGQVSADYETLKDVVFALLSEEPASVKQVFDTEAQTMRLVRVK
jgi:type I restriction enzyme S subunit